MRYFLLRPFSRDCATGQPSLIQFSIRSRRQRTTPRKQTGSGSSLALRIRHSVRVEICSKRANSAAVINSGSAKDGGSRLNVDTKTPRHSETIEAASNIAKGPRAASSAKLADRACA
jgi:hypothetical protein